MLSEKSIVKLCKRATKKNPKSVHIFDFKCYKARYIETCRGVFLVDFDGCLGWSISKVPYVGF